MTRPLPGGSTCGAPQLAELASSATPAMTTGLDRIDNAIGGLRPGAVWSIVGAAGVGVTVLATHFAVRVATCHRQLSTLVNGHLTAADIEQRVGHALADTSPLNASQARFAIERADMSCISFAQWMPLALEDSALRDRRLVVFDVVDEMYPAVADGKRDSKAERLTILRTLRAAARGHATAVVLTCRVTPGERDLRSTGEAWSRHPWHDAVTDVCDVHLTVGEAGRESIVTVESRSMRDTSCNLMNLRRQLRVTPAATV